MVMGGDAGRETIGRLFVAGRGQALQAEHGAAGHGSSVAAEPFLRSGAYARATCSSSRSVSSFKRVKIMRPAVVWSTLVTTTSTFLPI